MSDQPETIEFGIIMRRLSPEQEARKWNFLRRYYPGMFKKSSASTILT